MHPSFQNYIFGEDYRAAQYWKWIVWVKNRFITKSRLLITAVFSFLCNKMCVKEESFELLAAPAEFAIFNHRNVQQRAHINSFDPAGTCSRWAIFSLVWCSPALLTSALVYTRGLASRRFVYQATRLAEARRRIFRTSSFSSEDLSRRFDSRLHSYFIVGFLLVFSIFCGCETERYEIGNLPNFKQNRPTILLSKMLQLPMIQNKILRSLNSNEFQKS